MRDGSATLSDIAEPVLRLTCTKCDRTYAYGVAALMAERDDLKLTELRYELTRNCPRPQTMTDQCGLVFLDLPGAKRRPV